MEFPDNIPAANALTQTFAVEHGAELPDALREKLIEALAQPSPVDSIVKTGELLYAHRGELAAPAHTLTAQLISFAAMNGWHGLGQDNRGSRIVQAMRRDLGEDHPGGGEWPDPETDPDVSPEFAPAEEPDMPEPEGEEEG